MVLETLAFSSLIHLTQLVAREDLLCNVAVKATSHAYIRLCWAFTQYVCHTWRIGSRRLFFCFLLPIIFIYSLFTDAFSVTDYIASNERVIGELRIGKDVEGSYRGLF
jgi:hypothetical protein